MSEPPAAAVLPADAKLGYTPGSYPLDALEWPLGQPEHLRGRKLRHLSHRDHLVLFPRSTSYYRPGFGTRANVSMMIVEPYVIHERHMKKARIFHRRFFRVLSAYEPLIDAIPNGVFFPFGGTWVPEWETLDINKTKMTSLIATAKRSQPGHGPRHEIASWAQNNPEIDLEAIGRGYKPFDLKSEGLAPYRFSVVIENVREENYFTEKLIDAILCETVPIYLGCPNINRFMNTDGMITCETTDDLRNAVLSASDDLYQEKLPELLAIKQQAADYGALNRRAAETVLSEAARAG